MYNIIDYWQNLEEEIRKRFYVKQNNIVHYIYERSIISVEYLKLSEIKVYRKKDYGLDWLTETDKIFFDLEFGTGCFLAKKPMGLIFYDNTLLFSPIVEKLPIGNLLVAGYRALFYYFRADVEMEFINNLLSGKEVLPFITVKPLVKINIPDLKETCTLSGVNNIWDEINELPITSEERIYG